MAKQVTLPDDELREIGSYIVDEWEADQDDRDEWLEDLPRWIKTYQGRVEPKSEPWPDASNLHVPVTRTVIDAIHPRLLSALLRPDPVVSFRPVEEADDTIVRKREKFLDWALREEIGIFKILDRALLGTLVNGVQFLKVSWELEMKTVRDRHEFPITLPLEQVVSALMQTELTMIDAVTRIDDETIEAVVKDRKFELDVEQKGSKLVVYTDREEVVRNAPRVDILDPEDVVVNVDCQYDLQRAHHIFHRYWLTLDQIDREIQKGVFRKPTGEERDELERLAHVGIDTDDNTTNVKQQRDQIKGIESTTDQTGGPERIRLIDAYMRWDINDDGFEEEVIATVPYDKPDIILRLNRLEEVYRHGMRPFVLFYLYPLDNTIWANGVPFILDGLQTEFNVIHNQRVDAGTVANTPYGWYVPSSGLAPEKMPIEPGFMNPVDDINAVKMGSPANWTAWSSREEEGLWALVERLTKVSDLTLGRIGETQGASRTATGVQALAAQQATGFDILIRRAQECFRDLLQQVLALYQQYMPHSRRVRIMGKFSEPEMIVGRDDLFGKMDMIFTGNALSTDRETERNVLTFLAQSIMSPNALGFYMQLGLIQPQGIGEWLHYLLQSFDIPHLDRVISMPEQPRLLGVDEVISRTIQGETLTPQQGENHQQIIQGITNLLQEPIGLTAESIILLQQQVQLRQQHLQQEQMMQQLAQQLAPMMAQQNLQMPAGQGGAPQPIPRRDNRLAF